MSDSVTLWTVAHQAPLSVGFSRQEHWGMLPCHPPRDLPNPGTEPKSLKSPVVASRFFITGTTWEVPVFHCIYCLFTMCLHLLMDIQVVSISWLFWIAAAMNIGVHVSFWIGILSGYILRSGIAGIYGDSIFSFLRNLYTFFIVGFPTYIPTNSVGGLSSLHILFSIYL